MKIGYIRVSTQEQNTMRQEVLMERLGVEQVFIDKVSGKNTNRPELLTMLDFVRKGDVRLLTAVERHADHLSDLRALDVPFRVERTILIAADDVQCRARIDSLGVLDLVLIRERRPGAQDHDREHHSHTEHQAQNLLPP